MYVLAKKIFFFGVLQGSIWSDAIQNILVTCFFMMSDTDFASYAGDNTPVVTGQKQPQACNFNKKKTLEQAFSCEFCEFVKNTFLNGTPPNDCF